MDDSWSRNIQALKDRYRMDPVNAAWYLVGRHDPTRTALIWRDVQARTLPLDYGELSDQSARWAARLDRLGIGPGDRVAGLLPKRPELLLVALATWRLGAVYVPLFTAFGSDAVAYRVQRSRARVVITDRANRAKVPALPEVSVLDVDEPMQDLPPLDIWRPCRPQDPMILLYTSGTTGQPKGVPVPIWALAAFEAYMRWGLDLRPDDRFWNLADPGWAYGLYYGMMGPLLLGQATFWYGGSFDAAVVVDLLERQGITNFAAAPTAFRAIRAQGLKLPTTLRALSSAGEPLNPEVIRWAEETAGRPIRDHYGQTELGMVINNHQAPELERPLKLGSMGQAMPGFRAVVLDDAGHEVGPGTEGHIAIDIPASPLFWFSGYEGDPSDAESRLSPDGRYYLTGDDGSRDEDGYFFFTGRSDDVILSAGYRIGPFEVESTLMAHPAVAECAVVGVPDELRGQAVRAYVVVRPGVTPYATLADELKEWVRTRLAKTHYPREIIVVPSLPKTPSGKIQRFLLRNREDPS